MITTGKIKRFISSGKIVFATFRRGEVVCIIQPNTKFTMIDEAKTHTELVSTNSIRQLSKKVLKNIKLLKKYLPETYEKVVSSMKTVEN